MQSPRFRFRLQFRGGRPLPKILVGALLATGALAASASSAVATPVHPATTSARPAVITPHAETSIFIAYSAKGFGGKTTNISGCGVHNMPYALGSYDWIARGQSAYMYNVANAAGTIQTTLGSGTNADSLNPVGWKSLFIVC